MINCLHYERILISHVENLVINDNFLWVITVTVTFFGLMDSLLLSMQSPKRLSPSFVSKRSKVTCLRCLSRTQENVL